MRYRSRWVVLPALVSLVVAALFYSSRRTTEPQPARATASLPMDWLAMLESQPDVGFERVSGPWQPRLPDDHAAHPTMRTESWVLGMHLRDAEGVRLGVQFALLRVALYALDSPARASQFAGDLYRGHVALVAEGQARGTGEERIHRASFGFAGHDPVERRIWLQDWSMRYGEGDNREELLVELRTGNTSIEVVLTAMKPPVAIGQGENSVPFRAFALTRLAAEGVVRRGAREQPVSGLAWLDHTWGEVPLPVGPVVWDRIQLHLDDGSDVAFVRTRRRDGLGVPTASGYRVDAHGSTEPLSTELTQALPVRTWHREADGPAYPVAWTLMGRDLELNLMPLVEDQAYAFALPIWSGLVVAQGRSAGRPILGTGFLEVIGDGDR